VVLLKDFDGAVRPSEMVFDSMDIWVRVLDLPMDMMNRVYGEMIGGWIGKYISVEVDEDGMAWGEELRIRVAVRVDQPLIRGVPIKESDDEGEGRWFDIQYEKVPHFCFDCGRVVHGSEGCLADKTAPKQWGEWLRAEPKKAKKPPPQSRPTVSAASLGSWSGGSDNRYGGGISVRDIPPRRNLARDFSCSGSSRTGGGERDQRDREVSSPEKGFRRVDRDFQREAGQGAREVPRRRSGTYVRRQRQTGPEKGEAREPLGYKSKKRTKQVWLPVPVAVIGEGSSESAGKRQRTNSVFDRLEDPSADPENQGRRSQ
jgi:hypothetical protein